MHAWKLPRRAALLGTAAAALSPQGRAAAQEERRPLTVAVSRIPATIEPMRETGIHTERTVGEIFDRLLELDAQGNIIPSLGESWRQLDARTAEVTLRRGALFHNGDELTAEDVAFTFGPERLNSPGAPAWGWSRANWSGLDRVEAVDRYTVRIHMKQADAVLLKRLAVHSEVICKRAYLAAGSWDAWSRNAVGTGPFKLRALRTNDQIVLDAHDAYWGGTPPARSLTLKVVPEVAPRVAGLLSGDFDIVVDLDPDQLGPIERSPRHRIVGGAIPNRRWLMFNKNVNPVLQDVELRRALMLSVDRKLIVDTLWGGHVAVGDGWQTRNMGEMFLEGLPFPHASTYDLAVARRHLRASAYRGQVLEWPFMNNYYTNEVSTTEAVAAMWNELGVRVRITMVENRAQVESFPPALRNTSGPTSFPDPLSAMLAFGVGGRIQVNRWYDNAELNALETRMMAELDLAERRRLWRRILEIATWEDPVGLVFHQTGVFYGARRDLRWNPSQHDFPRLNIMEAGRAGA